MTCNDEPVSSMDPGDITIETYERAAHDYAAQVSHTPADAVLKFLDRFAESVGVGTVLELGSGPGWDATYLEARGSTVIRTDAANAFVQMLRAAGHPARRLDARYDDLGGPYDAVLADAVLLHLTRDQFEDVLARARRAVRPSGVLAFTLKEGDGAAWSNAKLDLPRLFTYWRAQGVRDVLARTGWSLVSLDHVQGRIEPWLYVIARADDTGTRLSPGRISESAT